MLKDNGWSISIATPELRPDQVSQVAQLKNTQGFAAFKPVEFTDDEIKALSEANTDIDNPKGKTRSERLRNVLFALFKHQDPIGVTFDQFYADMMEKIISHYKSKLPERD